MKAPKFRQIFTIGPGASMRHDRPVQGALGEGAALAACPPLSGAVVAASAAGNDEVGHRGIEAEGADPRPGAPVNCKEAFGCFRTGGSFRMCVQNRHGSEPLPDTETARDIRQIFAWSWELEAAASDLQRRQLASCQDPMDGSAAEPESFDCPLNLDLLPSCCCFEGK